MYLCSLTTRVLIRRSRNPDQTQDNDGIDHRNPGPGRTVTERENIESGVLGVPDMPLKVL